MYGSLKFPDPVIYLVKSNEEVLTTKKCFKGNTYQYLRLRRI
jgi:hypothetical protein